MTFKEKLATYSNREKHIAAFLALDIAVAIYYFGYIGNLPTDLSMQLAGLVSVVIELIIMASIASAIMYLAIHGMGKKEPMDERDRVIEGISMKAGFVSLIVMNVMLMVHSVLPEFEKFASMRFIDFTPLSLAHIILAMLIIANVVKDVVSLICYHRNI